MPVSLKRLKFIVAKWHYWDPAIRPWESLSEEQRGVFRLIALQPGELPLGAFVDGPNPLMISTHRLFWVSGGQPADVDLNRIASIRPPQDWNYDKAGLNTLVITTDDSKKYSLDTPPGETCYSIWNLILSFRGHGLGGRVTLE